jgi:molecular chaperone GrpE
MNKKAAKDRAGIDSAPLAKQPPAATAAASASSDAEPAKVAPAGPEPALTPEQVTELKARAAKADEYWDRLLRAAADLENFKKRAARERQEAVKFANESLLTSLIPALDNFDMALAAVDNAGSSAAESLKTGIVMVYNQLKAALAEAGLEEIDASGQPFDPKLQEAVSEQESAELPEGHVVQQLRKGYKLRERLIRPASVVVARKPAA